MTVPESNAVYRLLQHGLVIIEEAARRDHFMVVRPASLTGAVFSGCEGNCNVGMGGTMLATNAPPAMLASTADGWVVDVRFAGAPGPEPVWLNATYDTCAEAVDGIVKCYFGGKINQPVNAG